MTEPASGAQPFDLPGTAHIGRVALRVDSFDHVLDFYRETIGLTVDREGSVVGFSGTGGDPILVLEADPDAAARPREAAGLYHVAVRVPDRGALGDVCARVREEPWAFTGASDHLVSEALYMRDPAGIGIEVYRDRDRGDWPDTDDGFVGMETDPLDLDALVADRRGDDTVPAGTDVGHVHLEVTDRERSEAFYTATLGMRLRDRYGDDAAFVAAGDYHHHVGLNTWEGRTQPAGDTQGLVWWELVVPDGAVLERVADRLETAGHPVEPVDEGVETRDPDGIRLRLRVQG